MNLPKFKVPGFVKSRDFKYGANSIILILLLLGILWFISYLINSHPFKIDSTESKLNSLSPQTIKIIKELPGDLNILAFTKKGLLFDHYMKRFLEDISAISPKVKVKIVDLDVDKTIANAYGIGDYDVLVVEYNKKRKDLQEKDIYVQSYYENAPPQFKGEQVLVNAILSVEESKKKVIYFTEGHAEKDIDNDRTASGFSELKKLLLTDNYDVRKLNIFKEGKIPDDCTLLVIAGPQKTFANNEVDLVSKYLAAGGKAIVMLDPLMGRTCGLEQMLTKWEIKIDDDLIVDKKNCLSLPGLGIDFSAPLGALEKHEITEPLMSLEEMTFFPLSRSIQITSKDTAIQKTVLAETSSNAYGVVGMERLKDPKFKFDDSLDIKGPLNLAVIVSESFPQDPQDKKEPLKDVKFIVFGNSNFVTNAPDGVVGMQGNIDLFINSVNWIMEDENKISIRPKNIDIRPINLTVGRQILIFIMMLVVTPAAVIVIGIVVWFKRRSK